MYCTGDPKATSVSAKAYSKLGVDMPNYVYEGMWAEDTKDLNGTYDVDDFVTGFVRTDGPTITFNGAWAQNIGIGENYIDFLGTKGGARLTYGGDFTVYTTACGSLVNFKPKYKDAPMFQKEIDGFINCIKTGEKLPSHIDTVIKTAEMMQAMYDSSESGKEILLG
jgi:predicted dehydrogenase